MLMKSGLCLLLVAVLQVCARNTLYVEPDFIENVIMRETEAAPSSMRIVSGWEAKPGQHPHHAALRLVGFDGLVSSCGGSVVSNEWVLSAAHCTAGRASVTVRAGVVLIVDPEYISDTTEWYNHPLFNDHLPQIVQPNDISLIKLQTPVVYTNLLSAIRIQSSADAFRDYDGEQVYASGHGRTWTGGAVSEVLNWVYLRAVSNEACGSLFGFNLITDTSICARFFNVTSQSTCHGDSGGPLVHVGTGGVPTLIGVTSFVAGGDFGCHSGLPAGFIRPGPYLSWFEEVTGIDFENLNEDDEVEDETQAPPESEEEDTPAPPESEEEDKPAPPESEEEDKPAPPESEEQEEEEEDDDSDSSESNEDNEMGQLLKRLEVKVKVKVSLNKYKVKKEVEMEKDIRKHHNVIE